MAAAEPTGAFERRRRALSRDSSVDLRRDLVAPLDGNGVSTLDASERGATRSELSDPAAYASALRRSARALPGLLAALEEGLGGVRGDRAPSVRPLRGRSDLYLATGAGERVVFGVVGGYFVSGSDERRVRELAAAPTESLPGTSGSVAFRVPLGLLDQLAEGPASPRRATAAPAGELTGSVEADVERLTARVRLAAS